MEEIYKTRINKLFAEGAEAERVEAKQEMAGKELPKVREDKAR